MARGSAEVLIECGNYEDFQTSVIALLEQHSEWNSCKKMILRNTKSAPSFFTFNESRYHPTVRIDELQFRWDCAPNNYRLILEPTSKKEYINSNHNYKKKNKTLIATKVIMPEQKITSMENISQITDNPATLKLSEHFIKNRQNEEEIRGYEYTDTGPTISQQIEYLQNEDGNVVEEFNTIIGGHQTITNQYSIRGKSKEELLARFTKKNSVITNK